ncbi:kinase-like domain-containing protein, partial [Tribonema minus]
LKLQRLGKGASSSVYMAVCVRTLAVVALKESPIRTAADRDAVRSELQALRTQRSPLMDRSFVGDDTASPHIVRFYGGVMLQERTAVLAVELVAGGSLQAFIDRGSPAPEPWLAHVAHSCLLALQTLHENGRTHRDIKPANCLITCEGDAKLADFGCASGDLGRRMVGTRRYLPPEVLKGEAVLPKSDVWSFGLTMAAAACADPPVAQAQNEFEQLQAAERVRTTIAQLHNISPQLRDFLSLCLVVNPSERASIAELLEHPFLQR